jgi:hypothetical protein
MLLRLAKLYTGLWGVLTYSGISPASLLSTSAKARLLGLALGGMPISVSVVEEVVMG